jgi:hypothetical protein
MIYTFLFILSVICIPGASDIFAAEEACLYYNLKQLRNRYKLFKVLERLNR